MPPQKNPKPSRIREVGLALTPTDWLGWSVSLLVIVVSFCLGGTHITEPNYARYFHEPLFAVGFALGIAFCVKSLRAPATALRTG